MAVTSHRPDQPERSGFVGEFVPKIGREEGGGVCGEAAERIANKPVDHRARRVGERLETPNFTLSRLLQARLDVLVVGTKDGHPLLNQPLTPKREAELLIPLLKRPRLVAGESGVKLLAAVQLELPAVPVVDVLDQFRDLS